MPSKSPAQARLMAMAAHNPSAAKRLGIPSSVAQEFNRADTGTGLIRGAMNDGNKKIRKQPKR